MKKLLILPVIAVAVATAIAVHHFDQKQPVTFQTTDTTQSLPSDVSQTPNSDTQTQTTPTTVTPTPIQTAPAPVTTTILSDSNTSADMSASNTASLSKPFTPVSNWTATITFSCENTRIGNTTNYTVVPTFDFRSYNTVLWQWQNPNEQLSGTITYNGTLLNEPVQLETTSNNPCTWSVVVTDLQ